MAEATHCFIGVMDTVKLDMRAKDQVAPMVGDLLLALCKLGRLPADFEGTRCARKWALRMDTMRASECLSAEEGRNFCMRLRARTRRFCGVSRRRRLEEGKIVVVLVGRNASYALFQK